jgi:hypothetical protein
MATRRWRAVLLAGLAALASLAAPPPSWASHDPNRTATIYVDGFHPDGADRTGVYGAETADPLLDRIAALMDFPTSSQPGALLLPNVITTAPYYGDTPPDYYTAQDVADVDAITQAWGGGVPRYALIVAKYARHVLDLSGAEQVNFVSASFGSLIVRWLIEKNVEGLAGEARIARWLTIEGLVAGSWAASQEDLVGLMEFVQAPSVDVGQMRYAWVEQNLHLPRTQTDNPLYAGILIGQFGSTEDRLYNQALTGAMLARGPFQPNDGLQGLWDATFHDVAPAARFLGRPPTLSIFHDTHYGIRDDDAAAAQALLFCTQSRRVTITMTRARVDHIHESRTFLLDWRPAEIVFESRVRSPAIAARWGITGPVCTLTLEGAAPLIRRYSRDGDVQTFTQVLFDDFVLSTESVLDLELWAEEIDLDLRYGVTEAVSAPYYDPLGGGTLSVPVQQPGSYSFQSPEWSCDLNVQVYDYPFQLPVSVGENLLPRRPTLQVGPNPFSSRVRLLVRGPNGLEAPGSMQPATLSIYDAAGRLVQRMSGRLGDGFEWDGRDADGRRLPAGVYFHRLATPVGTLTGKSQLVNRAQTR